MNKKYDLKEIIEKIKGEGITGIDSESVMDSSIAIDGIGNYYGGLHIGKKNDKYFWCIENHDGMHWVRIPLSLYNSLFDFQEYNKMITEMEESFSDEVYRLRRWLHLFASPLECWINDHEKISEESVFKNATEVTYRRVENLMKKIKDL